MPVSPHEAFERLEELTATGELARLCSEQGIDALVIFGSVVDPNRAASARDLDVAVVLDRSTGADALRVVNVLADALRCDAVDVLDLGRADPVALEQALVGTAWLHERAPGMVASLRDRATMQRMDTDWLRALDLELMASS